MSAPILESATHDDAIMALRRERILTATGLAAEQFLSDSNHRTAFQAALRLLGEATAVSRVYVFQSVPSDGGEPLWSQRHEWCAEGIAPQIDNPDLQNLSMVDAGFSRWVEELSAGRAIFGPVREFPEAERPILFAQQIRSLVVMPVQVHGRLWGLIGFDDCLSEQGWNEAIVSCLRVAARVLGAAYERMDYKTHRDHLLDDYQLLLNSVREVIFRVGDEGRWSFLSPAWAELTGWSIAESLGRPCTDFIDPEFLGTARTTMGGLFSGQVDTSRWEGRVRLADGGSRWFVVNARRLPTAPGRGAEVVGTLIDVDDTKRAELALIEAKRAAEAANRAKSEFLSTMSHELRTPLNAVIGLTESLIEDGATLEPVRTQRYLEIIHRSGKQLLAQINDVLDLARIEAGQIRLVPARVDLSSLCSSAVEGSRRSAEAKRLALTFTRPSAPLCVMADEKLLRQVLNNLVSNAIKFTPEGGQITLGASLSEVGLATITVRDTGIGIPPEKLALLFKPFSQVDSSLARKYGGTGLGLTLVDRLVRLHGGTVDVASETNRGSVFTLSLRLAGSPSVSSS
ncbi:MAG: ATP-binding protein [Opitutaceae bacterium]